MKTKPNKKEILQAIFGVYEEWTFNKEFACEKCCAACCTQNVTMTAVEGELLLQHVREHKLQKWFTNSLQNCNGENTKQPILTHNTFAKNCLQGIETDMGEPPLQQKPCLFLAEDNSCRIYEARPFGCRCFFSLADCRTSGTAKQPDELLGINTVTMQIIEHLGQKEFWGNIYDILLALCGLTENKDLAELFQEKDQLAAANTRLLKAEPLPGFLIIPEEQEDVSCYLETLFNKKIQGRSLEDILNNK
jgi:Fe-S-cluster containining protein